MILAGQLLLDDGEGRCKISPGTVRIDGERIAEVSLGDIPNGADEGDADTLIAPGFIDAHLHLPQFDMIGAHGLPLLDWLQTVTFPAEMKWADTDFARAMTERVVGQLFSVGTLGICGFATVHYDATHAALYTAGDLGMRGVIGQVLMNREAPGELCRNEHQLIDEASQLSESFPAGSRMAAAISPRFALSCTESLLTEAGRLAEQHQSLIQTHLSETVRETQRVKQLFDGRSYVDVYKETGLLGCRSLLGHGIHLDDTDRRELRQRESTIVHCPTANSFLRSGTMNLELLRESNVAVAIGSDIGAGYERSMVRVGRAMIEAASSLGSQFPDAATAWRMITKGNAERLGWDDAGRLEEGASADLLVIRPSIVWQKGNVDPLAMLMFAWDDRWIEQVMVRGKRLR